MLPQTMNADGTDYAGTITLNWFYDEELALMRGCLKIVSSNHFMHENFISTLTGFTTGEFAIVLARFGKSPWLNRHDYDAINRAVFVVQRYRGNRERDALKATLQVSSLHLMWFGERVQAVLDDWKYHVENSDEQDRLRQQLTDEGMPDFPDF